MKVLSGKKTYILGAIAVIWGVYGWAVGYIDALQAQEVIWGGLTAIALRLGIAKK